MNNTQASSPDPTGTFYLVAPNLIGSGSTILPGNFGKNVASHPAGDAGKGLLCREMIFENVRLMSFPDRPSRLNCVFLFLDPHTAFQQMPVIGGLAPCLYAVKIKNREAKYACCDMNLIGAVGSIHPEASFYHETFNLATNYWRQAKGPQDPVYELLTESPVEVIELLGHGQN